MIIVIIDKGGIFITVNIDEAKEILLDNGFVVWKWGDDDEGEKLEGHLEKSDCKKLIGLEKDCFVAALTELNEARFITEDKFERKVQGHEKQFQIERIIFGEDKEKIYKDGELVLFETIISLDKVIDHFKNN